MSSWPLPNPYQRQHKSSCRMYDERRLPCSNTPLLTSQVATRLKTRASVDSKDLSCAKRPALQISKPPPKRSKSEDRLKSLPRPSASPALTPVLNQAVIGLCFPKQSPQRFFSKQNPPLLSPFIEPRIIEPHIYRTIVSLNCAATAPRMMSAIWRYPSALE